MSDSSSSSDERDEEEEHAAINPQPRTFIQARPGESYFYTTARPCKTASTKFSDRIDRPFTRTSFLDALQDNRPPDHVAFEQKLLDAYKSRYQLWQVELREGFSLLFYGLGSKRQLLDDFASTFLCRHGLVVVVKGFSLSLGITDVLGTLEGQLGLGSKIAGGGRLAADRNEARALAILDALSSTDIPIYLLVHSLDALPLRGHKSKNILALLAAHPMLHLLASVDHVNHMVLFPSSLSSAVPLGQKDEYIRGTRGFAFLHHHVPTLQVFSEEVLEADTIPSLFPASVFPSLIASKVDISSASRIQGTISVISSATEKAKHCFKYLAEQQIAMYETLQSDMSDKAVSAAISTTTPPVAITLSKWHSYCRSQFWTTNPMDFEQLIIEFTTHQIVAISPTPPDEVDEEERGSQWVWIKLDKDALESVLERIE